MFASQLTLDVPDFSSLPPWAYYLVGVAAWYVLVAAGLRLVTKPERIGSDRTAAGAVWIGSPVFCSILLLWTVAWAASFGIVASPWSALRGEAGRHNADTLAGISLAITLATAAIGGLLAALVATRG